MGSDPRNSECLTGNSRMNEGVDDYRRAVAFSCVSIEGFFKCSDRFFYNRHIIGDAGKGEKFWVFGEKITPREVVKKVLLVKNPCPVGVGVKKYAIP